MGSRIAPVLGAVSLVLSLSLTGSSSAEGYRLPTDEEYNDDVLMKALGKRAIPGVTRAGSTRLRLLLKPSFHAEFAIDLEDDGASVLITVTRMSSSLWHYLSTLAQHRDDPDSVEGEPLPDQPVPIKDSAAITGATAAAYRQVLADVAIGQIKHEPHQSYRELPDGRKVIEMRCDGMTIVAEYTDSRSQTKFEMWSPDKGTREFRILRAVFDATYTSSLQEETIRFLERIEGYFAHRFPLKEVPGSPPVVRVYGAHSFNAEWKPNWEEFLSRIGELQPVVVDLTNVESVAPAWEYWFNKRKSPRNVFWVPSDRAEVIPKWLGVSEDRIFKTVADAKKAALE